MWRKTGRASARASGQAARRASRVCGLGLLLLGLAAAPARSAVTLEAQLDRATVPVNGRVTLTVTITGAARAAEPELPELPDFTVMSAGSSRVVSMVNFKTTTSTIYTYVLVPKHTGRFEIPPITLVHEKQRLSSRRLQLTVVAGGASATAPGGGGARAPGQQQATGQPGIFIEAVAEPETVVVGEQVTLTVRFYQRARLAGQPSYERPPATGFWVEDLEDGRSYYTQIGGRRVHVDELRYALFPTEAGELTIGPAQVTAELVTRRRDPFRVDPFGDPFNLLDPFGRSEPVVVATDPITIEVHDLPRSGRPGSWSGAVGQYEIDAALDEPEVAAGDAVTLSVTIRGLGNPRSLGEPELPELPGCRSYMAETKVDDLRQGDRIGGVKTLNKIFIPGAPGTYEVPAIPYAFFDPERRAYREVSTTPLRLVVTEGAGGSLAGSAGTGAGAALREPLGDVAPDLGFIRLGDAGLRRAGAPLYRSPGFWLLQMVPLAFLAVGLAYARHLERVRGDLGYARLRRSGRVARRRLRAARAHLADGQVEPFLGALSAALVGYVADRLNLAAAGMTLDQARDLLRGRGVTEPVVERFVACVERCDFGRFAPGMQERVERGRLLEEAAAVLQDLGRAGV